MSTNVVPDATCPTCGARSNRGTNADAKEVAPTPGDLAICIQCAHVNTYDQNLTLVAMSIDQLLALDPEVRRAILYAQQALRRNGRAQA